MRVGISIAIQTDDGVTLSRAGVMDCKPGRLPEGVKYGIEQVSKEITAMLRAVEPTTTAKEKEES